MISETLTTHLDLLARLRDQVPLLSSDVANTAIWAWLAPQIDPAPAAATNQQQVDRISA